ncbi:MAG: SpoIID/LytB domain-containing protein [Candidatus Omnitrophica bacterium]|nr:SpoIID/LytB domain-containing protein [Candidatus Omnitrophota bacterium]
MAKYPQVLLWAAALCLTVLPGEGYGQKKPSHLNLALLFKENGEYVRAAQILDRAQEDDTPEVLRIRAEVAVMSGDPRTALEYYALLPRREWYDHIYQGLAYEQLDAPERACRAYEESLGKKRSSIPLYRLAKLHLRKKRYAAARKYFQELLDLDPSYRIAYYHLGRIFLREKEYASAYRMLSKAVRFFPERDPAETALAEARTGLGEEYFRARKKEKTAKRKKIEIPDYLPHTGKMVRVGLAEGLETLTLRCGRACIFSDGTRQFTGSSGVFYTLETRRGGLILRPAETQTILTRFSGPVTVRSSQSERGERSLFYLFDVIYGRDAYWHKRIDRMYRGNLRVIPRGKTFTVVNHLTRQEYLYGVLPAEILSGSPVEALRAQSVAARTIASRNLGRHEKQGYDFCADTHCQVYQGYSHETDRTNRAVDATRNEVLYFGSEPIETLYHSNCGGCVRSDAYGKRKYFAHAFDFDNGRYKGLTPGEFTPFLEELWFYEEPKAFSYRQSTKYRWQRAYDAEDYRFAFGDDLRNVRIRTGEKDECFHHDTLEITSGGEQVTVRGDWRIRKYFQGLRSSAFKFEQVRFPSDADAVLLFWGAGFGHGTGLCQDGAVGMASQGFSYEKILTHYYPHTRLIKEE